MTYHTPSVVCEQSTDLLVLAEEVDQAQFGTTTVYCAGDLGLGLGETTVFELPQPFGRIPGCSAGGPEKRLDLVPDFFERDLGHTTGNPGVSVPSPSRPLRRSGRGKLRRRAGALSHSNT